MTPHSSTRSQVSANTMPDRKHARVRDYEATAGDTPSCPLVRQRELRGDTLEKLAQSGTALICLYAVEVYYGYSALLTAGVVRH